MGHSSFTKFMLAQSYFPSNKKTYENYENGPIAPSPHHLSTLVVYLHIGRNFFHPAENCFVLQFFIFNFRIRKLKTLKNERLSHHVWWTVSTPVTSLNTSPRPRSQSFQFPRCVCSHGPDRLLQGNNHTSLKYRLRLGQRKHWKAPQVQAQRWTQHSYAKKKVVSTSKNRIKPADRTLTVTIVAALPAKPAVQIADELVKARSNARPTDI